MTSEPPRTVFFLSDFGTAGRVRRRGARGHCRARPGNDRHRPDAPHPALRRPGGEPHVGAGRAVPRTRSGARRRRPRSRHGAPGHRPARSRCPPARPCGFVGPDNGLLVAAAEAAAEAPVARVVELARRPAPPDRGSTFDGRDLFAPAVAALCAGVALEELGEPVDPASLVRLVGGVVEEGRLHDGRVCLRTEVTWVDRFGNLQLAATVADARVAGIPLTGCIELAARIESGRQALDGLPHSLVPDGVQLRCVDAFGQLATRGVRPAGRRQRASRRGGRRGVGGRTGSTWPQGSCSFWPGDGRLDATVSGLVPPGAASVPSDAVNDERRSSDLSGHRGGSPRRRCCGCPSTSGSWPSWSAPAPGRCPRSSWPSWPASTRPRCARTSRCWARSAPGARATTPSSSSRRSTVRSGWTRTGRSPWWASATWAAPSPIRPGSPRGAARSPRSSTSTRRWWARRSGACGCATWTRSPTLRAAECPDIGVITTPGWAAQGVADLLVRAGVTSSAQLRPPGPHRAADGPSPLRGPVH